MFLINAQGWIGIPRHQNVNNAGYGFWCPDWPAGWRAYIHFSLVRVADLNSVLRANFGAYKNQRRAAFYLSTEFLGCTECECFAGAVSLCIVCGNLANMHGLEHVFRRLASRTA